MQHGQDCSITDHMKSRKYKFNDSAPVPKDILNYFKKAVHGNNLTHIATDRMFIHYTKSICLN